MNFDPNDFQDQAELLAVSQRQRQLALQERNLRELEKNGKFLEAQKLGNSPAKNIPRNRTCPWCGGLLAGMYAKCQNCASDISWVGDNPFQPGSREESKEATKLREKIIADKIYAKTIIACQICKVKILIKDSPNHFLCRPCWEARNLKSEQDKRKKKDKEFLIGLAIISLMAIIVIIFWLSI